MICISLSGEIVPLQVLYSEKNSCTLSKLPKYWEAKYASSALVNSKTMNSYIIKILKPYIKRVKREQNISSDEKALVFLDRNKAHQAKTFTDSLDKADIHYIYIPAGTTSIYQPLDVDGLLATYLKEEINRQICEFSSDILKKGLHENYTWEKNWVPTLQLPLIKINQWLENAYKSLQTEPSTIIEAWKTSNIEEAIRKFQRKIK